jgi:hypothetical protein
MAVNQSRNMSAEFHTGIEENSYMQLTPNRGGVIENPPIERLSWPTYAQCLQHRDAADPFAGRRPVAHEVHTGGTATNNRRT